MFNESFCKRKGYFKNLGYTQQKRGKVQMVEIPKTLFQIWIGDRAAPLEWMATWKKTHPDWEYKLIDNSAISQRRFRNQKLINEYIKRREFPGAADLIRYELLHEFGGFMPGADAISLQSTNELWSRPTAYTVYENEIARPGLVSPILASNPNNAFLQTIIDKLHEISPTKIDKAWRTTGNQFVAKMLSEYDNDVVIFPSHYFIPKHFSGQTYSGNGKIYAEQRFGETVNAYAKISLRNKAYRLIGRARSAYFRKIRG